MSAEKIEELFKKAHQAHQAGQFEVAEKIGREMEALAPGHPKTWIVLAHSSLAKRDLIEAAKYLNALHEKDPDHLGFRQQLTEIYRTVGYFEEAVEIFRPVFEKSPKSSQIFGYFGHLCAYGGREEEALEHFKEAENLAPADPEIKVALAGVYITLGQPEDATEVLKAALALNPGHIHALALKADLKMDLSDQELKSLKTCFETTSQHLGLRIDAAFGYAKAMKNTGDAKTTFEAYELANGLAGRLFQDQGQRFDPAIEEANFKAITEIFNPSGKDPGKSQPPTPIFIIGLPRTGTTLVEQILSAHPQIEAAGELKLLGEFPMRLEAMTRGGSIADKKAFLENMVPELREEYRNRIRKKAPDAALVTDKMPLNFYWVGLAAKLFPEAKFIFIERDPLDACLSMFFQPLTGSYVATTDLRSCGRLYGLFQKYLAHWRGIPELQIHPLSYETLVGKPEQEIKKLIEFLGLPWDEACLNFYQKPGAVRTLSTQQVREPVTPKYVGQWKPYKDFLDPLKKALDEK